MIGKYLEGLDDAALQRVVEEPMGEYYRPQWDRGVGCILQVVGQRDALYVSDPVGLAFDHLIYGCTGRCARRDSVEDAIHIDHKHTWGSRIVPLIKARAQRILDRRVAERLWAGERVPTDLQEVSR